MSSRPRTGAKPAFAPRVLPLGDGAVMAELADRVDLDANAAAHRIAADVRRNAPEWVVDVVPAIVTVTLHFAAATAADAAARRNGATRLLLEAIEREGGAPATAPGRVVEIPVCYQAPHALDLAEVAAATGLPEEEVVRAHVESAHRVLMIGFVPGHPYIGGLDARLGVPRRASPRARMEPGAVAIANAQTSIYPFATPGGWNVIGRTPLVLFDPAREPPSLLEAGDGVAFVPISRETFDRIAAGRGR
jgi:KipI family sensor histidine kinase inhibitor